MVGWQVALVDLDGDGVLDVPTGNGAWLLTRTLHDTTAPAMPRWLTAFSGTPQASVIDGAMLTWEANSEPDVTGYRIYRGSTEHSRSRIADLLGSTTVSYQTGSLGGNSDTFWISALDESGNESAMAQIGVASIAALATGDGEPDIGISGRLRHADLDGDGDRDLLIVRGSGEWATLSNNGSAVFTQTWTRRWLTSPGTLAALADVNGDNLPDALVVDVIQQPGSEPVEFRTVLGLYLNSAGSFPGMPVWNGTLPALNVETGTAEGRLAWGDANGDGRLDLAVRNGGRDGQTILFLNSASGLATTPGWTSSFRDATALTFGRIDADAFADLAVTTGTSPTIQVFRGQTGGLGATPVWSHNPNPTQQSEAILSWRQVDGDAGLDLTLHGEGAAYYYRNVSSGFGTTFTNDYFVRPTGSSTDSAAARTFTWADVNADGEPDLISSSWILPGGGVTGIGDHILNRTGPLMDETAWVGGLSKLLREPWDTFDQKLIDAADFNNDGSADLIFRSGVSASLISLSRSGPLRPLTTVPTLTGITATPTSALLDGNGATVACTAIATYSDASTRDVTPLATFRESDPERDLITWSGNVARAKHNGVGSVWISYGTFSAYVSLTVINVAPLPVSLSLSPSVATLDRAGAMQTYTVTATLDNGEVVDVSSQASVTVVDAAVASMNGGIATALANGTTAVNASWSGFTASASLTVAMVPTLDTLTVNPGSATLTVGERKGVEVIAHYSDGAALPVTVGAAFTSANSASAEVVANAARGVAPGTATITATYLGMSATATVTVIADPRPGDVNGDRVVNVDDLSFVTANFGRSSPEAAPNADTTGDGVVNVDDLSLITANFGRSY